MDSHKNTDIKAVPENNQISFMSLNNDMIADRLRRTNIDELSDSECREVLRDLSSLL